MTFLLSSSLGGGGVEGYVVVMLGFRVAEGEGVTEGAVVVEETTNSGGGGGILGDDTGVGASGDVNIVVAALVCYTDTMVGMQYYDLPILRLIIGAEVDKVLRVCEPSFTLFDISKPHSVGFSPPIAYSVFMSSLGRSSL